MLHAGKAAGRASQPTPDRVERRLCRRIGVSAALLALVLSTIVSVGALSLDRAVASPASDTLSTGQSLSAGQSLISANSKYSAVVQSDGNFVVYGPGSQVLFATRTFGSGASLVMQNDGNLVLYVSGRAPFATGTTGIGAFLILQDDGNAVVYSGGRALWSSSGGLIPPPLVLVVSAGASLSVGQALMSPDSRYYALVQADGNFVVYGPGSQVLFATRTSGAGASLAMQTDGNLVLYVGGRALFASGSRGSNAYLVVQNDGNAVVYAGGRALWSSRTGLIVLSFSGSGDYRVGVDIAPGTYRTRTSQSGCYWERDGVFASDNDIIANNETDTTDVVTIAASDAGFYSDGCATWTQDLSPLRSSQTANFGDGTWIVDTDVSPGTWTAPGGSGTGCYWARVSTFSGELNDIVDNHFSLSGPTSVTIFRVSDAGFQSYGCGTWTKVG